jgi:serine/threonine-protein kinase
MAPEDDVEARARARVGSTLKDKWKLDELLGVGGMAAIYAATHRNLKRVAVKILHSEFSAHPEARTRFLREGYVANSIGHPGAVIIDDDDTTEDGSAFLVMELLEGETLHARWERKGRKLGLRQVLSYADALLDVLKAAQAKGVVHRDVKPENLFLTTTGTLKVLDFGIARVRELSNQTTSAGTKLGAIMGTPAFMAPEQARGRWDHVDAQTDLWAVGATMFTLLSGSHVHEAETPNEQLALACTQDARSIATAVKNLPPRVVALIDRALAYDKANRWLDAASMQVELRAAYNDLKTSLAEARALAGPDSRPSAPVPDLGIEVTGSFPAVTEAKLEKVLVEFRDDASDEIGRITAAPVLKSTELPTVIRSSAPTTAGGVSGESPRGSAKPTVFLVIAAVAIAAVALAMFASGTSGTANEGATVPAASASATIQAAVSAPPAGSDAAPRASGEITGAARKIGSRPPGSTSGFGKAGDKRKSAPDSSKSAAAPATATPPPPAPTDTAKPPPPKPARDMSDLGF